MIITPNHAGRSAAACIGRTFGCVCDFVCLSVCLCLPVLYKEKVDRDIVTPRQALRMQLYSRLCTDIEVK